ncbi:DNA helicase, partial [Tanacetum coccineum]
LMATSTYPDTTAASKGKMIVVEPEIADIASLKPTDSNKTIEVIVYHKWVSNGNIIQLALWHEMALEFNVKEYEKMEKPVVIAVNPQNYQRARFTSHATIYKITTQNKWYYERCTVCKNQVIPGDPIPICKNHRPQPTPTYSKEANSLVKDYTKLLNELPDKNPYQLPLALKELEGTTHTFQFHFDINSTLKRKVFVLDTVFTNIVPPLPTPPAKYTVPKPISTELPTTVMVTETCTPALSRTASNEFEPQQQIRTSLQQSPTSLGQPEDPMKNQEEEVPVDLPQPSTKEEPSVSADIQASQSTPPKIKKPQ